MQPINPDQCLDRFMVDIEKFLVSGEAPDQQTLSDGLIVAGAVLHTPHDGEDDKPDIHPPIRPARQLSDTFDNRIKLRKLAEMLNCPCDGLSADAESAEGAIIDSLLVALMPQLLAVIQRMLTAFIERNES